jgi:hypothetical protein
MIESAPPVSVNTDHTRRSITSPLVVQPQPSAIARARSGIRTVSVLEAWPATGTVSARPLALMSQAQSQAAVDLCYNQLQIFGSPLYRMTQTSPVIIVAIKRSMEYAQLCMSMRLANAAIRHERVP